MWVARGKWGSKSRKAARLGAGRSKRVPGALKMNVVVSEDYGRGCKEKKKHKHGVEMSHGVRTGSGAEGL